MTSTSRGEWPSRDGQQASGAPAARPIRPSVGDMEVPPVRGVRHEKGPPGLQAADDRQRDLFPLPAIQPTPPTVSPASPCTRRRLARRRQTEQCANDAIAGLNALHPPCEQHGPITAAQRLATATVLNEVRMAPKSDTLFSRRGAAKELLASSLSYTGDEAPSPVVRYVRSRVDIPEVGAVIPPVESVLDEIGKKYVLDYEHAMMKTPDE